MILNKQEIRINNEVKMMNVYEIDYKLYGDDMQFVEIELDFLESVIVEVGGMMMMEDDIEMEIIFGDGFFFISSGLFNKLKGVGKCVLIGESLFMMVYINNGYYK